MSDENKVFSFIEKMKLRAQSQQNYGGELVVIEASTAAATCTNCGAGRAKQDGLTKCAYCGFAFNTVELTNGLHITKDDNSK